MATAMHLEALRRKQALEKQNWIFLGGEPNLSKYESQVTDPMKAARRAKNFSANLNRKVEATWWPFRKERPYTASFKKRFSDIDYFTQW